MKGKISISKYSSNQPPYRGVTIELEDNSSGVHFLTAEMTIEQFAEAITGSSMIECEFELRGTKYVGMKRENKEVWIDLKEGEYVITDKRRQKELLLPYEIDGWMGSDYDLANSHNRDKHTNAIRVHFIRYVKAEE